ncbi:50S ribosomal protein L44e [Candidatus Woesearchaeota archaeon]|nr:50S ribosomal protein L44e [Candidatus Woesearchaeota archaeon]
MKFPKQQKKYCKFCKKHTAQALKQQKDRGKNKAHAMTRGSRRRMKLRGLDRGFGNHGKTSKGAMSGWSMFNKKRTKKTDLRYTCSVCKKTNIIGPGFRAGKVEFV